MREVGQPMGVFKDIKELHAAAEPISAVARVIATSRPTSSSAGDPTMRVKLNISGATIESYEVIVSVPVPPCHVEDVVPGALLAARVDRANPKGVTFSWSD